MINNQKFENHKSTQEGQYRISNEQFKYVEEMLVKYLIKYNTQELRTPILSGYNSAVQKNR